MPLFYRTQAAAATLGHEPLPSMSLMSTTTIPLSLSHHFAALSDPRVERTCQHELLDIVGIALCAVI